MPSPLFRARRVLAVLLLAITAIAVTPNSASAFPNGRAPRSALARIYHPSAQLHVYLAKPAAAAFNTMVLYAAQQHAAVPYVAGSLSAYRPFAGQLLLRKQWCAVGRCANAAIPGHSNHGLGHAIDLANPVTMRPWLDRRGAYFGWSKRWSDAPWEPWHILWRPGHWKHRPDPGPDPLSPRLAWHSGGRGQAYWVRQLQRYLHVHADGSFGRATARALRHFRRAHHLKPRPAVTTPKVWALLRNPAPAKHDTPPPKQPIPVPKVPPKTTPVAAVATVIDVSSYQGSIDATKVAHAGVSAIVEKTSEGLTYHDPRWTKARVHAIRAAHLVLGTYHFLRPQPGRSAAAEATFAVRAARAGGWRAKSDLPIGEDLETSAFSQHTAAGWCAVARYGLAFAKHVRKLTGRYPLLYSYPGFLNSIPMSCRKALGVLKLWIAHYRVKAPIVPWPWSNARRPGYTAWQFDDSGRIPGISGHVDLSLVAGGVPALRRLASAR